MDTSYVLDDVVVRELVHHDELVARLRRAPHDEERALNVLPLPRLLRLVKLVEHDVRAHVEDRVDGGIGGAGGLKSLQYLTDAWHGCSESDAAEHASVLQDASCTFTPDCHFGACGRALGRLAVALLQRSTQP